MTDKELVEEILKSNQKAFRELVEKYQSLVVNTCNGFLHDKNYAEDIAQEVFIEVFLSIHNYRGDARLSTWLYRIAVNKSLNFIRSNKKRQFIKSIETVLIGKKNPVLITEDDSSRQLEGKKEMEEKAEMLYKAINSLTKNQKIAFTLSKYDNLSYKQISDIMELSLSSVESLMHRAKKNVQKKILSQFKK